MNFPLEKLQDQGRLAPRAEGTAARRAPVALRRVLFVCPYAPSPVKPRPLALLLCVAKELEVHLACPGEHWLSERSCFDRDALAEIESCGVVVHRFRPFTPDAIANLGRLARGYSLRASIYSAPWLRRQLARLVERIRPSIVHVDRLRSFSMVEGLDLPKVVDLTDPLGAAAARASIGAGIVRRLLLRREEAALWRDEARVSLSHEVLFASQSGTELFLERVPYANAHWVPHPVARSAQRDGTARTRASPADLRLVFAGSLGYWPNIQGIEWFLASVLPLLRRELQGVSLTIVGSGAKRRLRGLARALRVELIDGIDDMSAALTRAHLAVVPIMSSGGFPNKVADALLRGRIPVLVSPSATAGLPGPVRKLIPTASEPREWVMRIVQFARDPTTLSLPSDQSADMLAGLLSSERCRSSLLAVYDKALARARL